MSMEADAAGQVVNIGLKAMETTVTLAGKGAVNFAAFLLALLKEQERTKGKVGLRAFRGKNPRIFTLQSKEKMRNFHQYAKKYSILYACIKDRKQGDGQFDIVVRTEDAARVNRVIERYRLNTPKLSKETEDSQVQAAGRDMESEPMPQRPPAAHDEQEDNALIQQLFHPMAAGTEKQEKNEALSAPFLNSSGDSSREISADSRNEPESVRARLMEVKAEALARRQGKAHIPPLEIADGTIQPDGIPVRPKQKGR